VILPFLLLFGMTTLVACNYCSILLHRHVPSLVFVIMPSWSVFVTGLWIALFPPTVKIHEESKHFLRSMQLLDNNGKHWARLVKSERNLRVYFASFFYARMSTEVTLFSKILDYTITSIMIGR
jgi:hypothetical protein